MDSNTIYEQKLRMLYEFIMHYYYYLRDKGTAPIVYIDGGECTGTTTISKKVCAALNESDKFIWTREPSQHCKDTIITPLSHERFLENPGKKIEYITEVFTSDRAINQQTLSNNEIKISDRGMFSTFIYQSGILNPAADAGDVMRNCQVILDKAIKFDIRLPITSINLVSLLENDKEDEEVFNYRLNRRIQKGEKLDGMDKFDVLMRVNKAYSDISRMLIKAMSPLSFRTFDFKDDMDEKVNNIILHIHHVIDSINTIKNSKNTFNMNYKPLSIYN